MSVTHDNERSTYGMCLQGVRPRATIFACMIPDLHPGSSHGRGTSRHCVPQERYWRAGTGPWRAITHTGLYRIPSHERGRAWVACTSRGTLAVGAARGRTLGLGRSVHTAPRRARRMGIPLAFSHLRFLGISLQLSLRTIHSTNGIGYFCFFFAVAGRLSGLTVLILSQ